jgi:hypothetical protein
MLQRRPSRYDQDPCTHHCSRLGTGNDSSSQHHSSLFRRSKTPFSPSQQVRAGAMAPRLVDHYRSVQDLKWVALRCNSLYQRRAPAPHRTPEHKLQLSWGLPLANHIFWPPCIANQLLKSVRGDYPQIGILPPPSLLIAYRRELIGGIKQIPQLILGIGISYHVQSAQYHIVLTNLMIVLGAG